MKILITGAFSTGKTSLVNRLASSSQLKEHFSKALVRSDPARVSPLPLHREQTLEASLWLAAKIIGDESVITQQEADDRALMVCDRGFPDILSHTPFEDSDPLRVESVALKEMARVWSTTYELTFLSEIDHEISVDVDGFRLDDADYRQDLQSRLIGWLNHFELPYTILPFGLEQRHDFVVESVLSHVA